MTVYYLTDSKGEKLVFHRMAIERKPVVEEVQSMSR
jgi:hypothetical protein